MRWIVLILVAAVGCGKGDSNDGSTPDASQPAKPKVDPAEAARLKAEADAKAEAAREAAAKQRRELTAEIKTLEQAHKALVAKNEAEAAGLPNESKLRRVLRQLRDDARRSMSMVETDQKRFEELKKEVQATASDEIKQLDKAIAKKEREYNALLSGAKAERANAELGIAEETQVQKEIRTLREAKQQWFAATRDTRRGTGGAPAKSKASSTFKSWFKGEPLRATVVKKALQGQSPDAFDFSGLDFYLFMELLEDSLDRQNVAEEKKTISANELKLVAMEKELDALTEKRAELMSAGGGALEEFDELERRLPGDRQSAEGLQRQVEELRASFNAIQDTLTKHDEAEEELQKQIDAKKKELKKLR
ncbi:MAG: hypothetical protein AAGD14_08125 [Planctomycetota bacterium]